MCAIAGLVLAMVFTASGALADENGYRVAGIIALGGDRLLAVVELPDRRQTLVRSGDRLGDAEVMAIETAGVRVVLGGKELLLPIRGAPRALSNNVGEVAVIADAPQSNVSTQGLAFATTTRQLDAATRGATTTMPRVQGAARGAGAPGAGDSGLAARVNSILDLPADAHITAVDRTPTTDPQQVIDELLPRLAAGRAVRLTLGEGADADAVYLTPVE